MIIRDFTARAVEALQPLYDQREASAVVKVYLQTKMQMPAHELALRVYDELSSAQATAFLEDLERLRTGCPVQYVLGETEFYGRTFAVSPAVLIPRPETEELVQLVCQQLQSHPAPKVWDVGTGSGCIAASLACELPQASLFASDISQDALQVADRNAARLDAKVIFAHHDMCDLEHLPFSDTVFDLVISNPPYIPAKERAALQCNVREFEPAGALFVPDDDPLRFYVAIAEIGRRKLKPGGRVAVETYEDFHVEMAEMFRQKGYDRIESIEDINGRKRMMTAQLERP